MIRAAAGCVTRRHVAGAELDEDAHVCDADADADDVAYHYSAHSMTMSTVIVAGLHPS